MKVQGRGFLFEAIVGMTQDEMMTCMQQGMVLQWHTVRGTTVSLACVEDAWILLAPDVYSEPIGTPNLFVLFAYLDGMAPRLTETGYDMVLIDVKGGRA
jgi:hypothetical protein